MLNFIINKIFGTHSEREIRKLKNMLDGIAADYIAPVEIVALKK